MHSLLLHFLINTWGLPTVIRTGIMNKKSEFQEEISTTSKSSFRNFFIVLLTQSFAFALFGITVFDLQQLFG